MHRLARFYFIPALVFLPLLLAGIAIRALLRWLGWIEEEPPEVDPD